MNDITLLENGLDYILNALINLEKIENKNNDKYTIKYIIRDLISGVEIVLKYRLEVENWTYIIDSLDNTSINDYNIGNFISVTLEKAINRLGILCKVQLAKSDVSVLEDLKQIRNKIEHFKFNLNEIQTIMVVNNCISIILKFINSDNNNFKYKFTPEEKKLFNEISNRILKLQNYLSQKEIDIKIKYPSTPFVECPNCHRKCLISKKEKSICFLCDSEFLKSTYQRIKYINENQPTYREIHKGASPIEERNCPYCGDIIVWDYENSKAKCFECGFNDNIENIELCEKCGEILKNEEFGICGNCLDDMGQYQSDIMRGK